jgi:hypothetical protein
MSPPFDTQLSPRNLGRDVTERHAHRCSTPNGLRVIQARKRRCDQGFRRVLLSLQFRSALFCEAARRNGESATLTIIAKPSWSCDQSLASRHDPTVTPQHDRIDLSQSWHGVPTRRFPCAPGPFQGGNAINNIPHCPALNGSGPGLGDRHELTHGLRLAFFRRGMRCGGILLRDRRGGLGV